MTWFRSFAKRLKTIGKTTFCDNAKTSSKYLIKPVVYCSFRSFSQKWAKRDKKTIRFFTTGRMGSRRAAKPYKTLGKWRFLGASYSSPWRAHEAWCKAWFRHRKLTMKIDSKLTKSMGIIANYGSRRPPKRPKNHCQNNVLRHRENQFKIPYKTCRLLIILRSFSQKWSKKDKNTITFFTIPWCDFAVWQNHWKPLVKQRFAATRKLVQNTL